MTRVTRTASAKRVAGSVTKSGRWKVITESKGKTGIGYVHKCGAEVFSYLLRGSVWDGVGLCSGGGEVQTITVPYCAGCEELPKQRIGIPVMMT